MTNGADHPRDVPSMRMSRRVMFPGGNGFELAGIVDQVSNSGDTANSTVVVFSHCFTCNKDLKAIVRISRSLAASGFTVLRYDMTGLGGSDGDFSWTNFTTNVADLRAAIRFATAELGPVAGLIGHSFGGAASLAVAGSPSDAESSIKCVATLAAPSDTQHLANLLELKNPRIPIDGIGDVEIGGRRWTIRKEMTADFRSHRLSEVISRITIPLLVIHSPSDETVGFDEAIRIFQLASIKPQSAGSSDASPVSFIALDGADHLLANSNIDIAYVAEVLAAFFRRYR